MNQRRTFREDRAQRSVINITNGYHIVLAPPGCGKTQILTERVRRAHQENGISYNDMLCLTFTNRAARGMYERIEAYIGDSDVSNMYVGNIHRYCSKMLFEGGYVPVETSIIDDDDIISILATQMGEDEAAVAENNNRRRAYFEIYHFSHLMKQMKSGHATSLRMHPECFNTDDVEAVKKICEVQRMQLSAESVLDIYDNHDFYLTACSMDGYDMASQVIISRLLMKMKQASTYEKYKRDNLLIDFEDLLIESYDIMTQDAEHRHYKWIQVDEVQDLNPLQLAIVDLLTDKEDENFNVLYLGDEQQAIFSFMGAKLSTLDYLRKRCGKNIHFLNINHRSPKYLLDVFNTYAEMVLHIPHQLLPKVAEEEETKRDDNKKLRELKIIRSNLLETEYYDVAHLVKMLSEKHPDDNTAVIVSSNSDADMISNELHKLKMPHFKVSGDDLFTSESMKFCIAHLNLLNNEFNFIAWARLMKTLKVFASSAYARNFVRHCMNRAMLPDDFLMYDDSTYTQEFLNVCNTEEVVVFDTETTGLDTLNDDIAQIAAMKMRNGQIVEGSEFNVYIETNKEIPLQLGDIVNPLIEERKNHKLLPPKEALEKFAEYANGATLIGHNTDFDWNILRSNCNRYAAELDFTATFKRYFDTLKLSRLLIPGMQQYKLKHLLAVLCLEGENSHLADDDVRATCSLVTYCMKKAEEKTDEQKAFMAQKRVKERMATLRRNYKEVFLKARSILYTPSPADSPALVQELTRIYNYGVENAFCKRMDKADYAMRYIACDILAEDEGRTLSAQLSSHILEINTMKEADLCGGKSISDKVFVTTVHKAKGLEFDNVVVFDVVEDRYPNYGNRNNPAGMAEDARKLYVAMTRARKRLYVSHAMSRSDYKGNVRARELSRFMIPIEKFFI